MVNRIGIVCAALWIVGAATAASGQSGMSNDDRALYKRMLTDIRKDIEENYYDPKLRGVDLAAAVEDTGRKVAAATSTAEAVDALTGLVFAFDDSHTRFIPPMRATRASYGWEMAAVGDAPLVLRVDKDSDAAKKGLAPGDRVLAVNRLVPTRRNLWQISHYYGVVRPQARQRVVVRKPDGTERALDIDSKIETRKTVQLLDAVEDEIEEDRAGADTYTDVTPGILVWHMTRFRDGEDMRPFVVKARKAGMLILDLRGNHGGLVEGLKALVGMLFDHDVVVMTRVQRKGSKIETGKARRDPFLGRLIVLVDSRSASASEILARVVQIEKRGTVIGDQSAGAVMASSTFVHEFGIGNVTLYGTQVTVSDVRMSDGGGLEHVGVTPDERLLPSPEDLAKGRDVVLARAIELAGGSKVPAASAKTGGR